VFGRKNPKNKHVKKRDQNIQLYIRNKVYEKTSREWGTGGEKYMNYPFPGLLQGLPFERSLPVHTEHRGGRVPSLSALEEKSNYGGGEQ